MRMESINRKKYILVIVDDYSRFMWVKFLRTKDETPEIIIKFLKQAQASLQATVRYLRTNNGTEFINQTLREYTKGVGITHQTSVARTPQQNDVVKRRDHMLLEAARNMMIFSKTLLFLWAKAIVTTKIHVDSESAVCVVKNHVYHSKTKHIKIRHHFIRDPYEKRLIEMVKIHTDYNVADLLIKAFDVTRVSLDSGLPLFMFYQLCSHWGDSAERAITTDASLVATHDSDTINKTQTTTMPNVDLPQGMDTCGSPKRQETIGGTPAQTSTVNRVTTLGNELSSTKAVYHKAFITLTKRVKKLETQLKQKRSRAVIHSSDEEEPSLDAKDSPKQGRMIGEIDKDETINMVSKQGEVQEIAGPLKDDDDATLAEYQEEYNKRSRERVFSKGEVRKNICTYLKNQGGYKQSYFKRMKYEQIEPIFKKVWDQIHTFVPKDSEIEKEVMKRSGFNLQQESSKKHKLDEQTEEEVVAQAILIKR
uniref:Putative ribonuclease H-like domain-containing protein n=1 Tax=Tanacetum cinerariifolium TaxID=118510 RepID=A0A6L2NVA1_TANCI|nr:putative ribonuclease H-like domain-containing protein [Tanacetum cinerariifolium]